MAPPNRLPLEKSNGELKKQFITSASVQLNGGNGEWWSCDPADEGAGRQQRHHTLIT